jgi:hypothetical protein
VQRAAKFSEKGLCRKKMSFFSPRRSRGVGAVVFFSPGRGCAAGAGLSPFREGVAPAAQAELETKKESCRRQVLLFARNRSVTAGEVLSFTRRRGAAAGTSSFFSGEGPMPMPRPLLGSGNGSGRRVEALSGRNRTRAGCSGGCSIGSAGTPSAEGVRRWKVKRQGSVRRAIPPRITPQERKTGAFAAPKGLRRATLAQSPAALDGYLARRGRRRRKVEDLWVRRSNGCASRR